MKGWQVHGSHPNISLMCPLKQNSEEKLERLRCFCLPVIMEQSCDLGDQAYCPWSCICSAEGLEKPLLSENTQYAIAVLHAPAPLAGYDITVVISV